MRIEGEKLTEEEEKALTPTVVRISNAKINLKQSDLVHVVKEVYDVDVSPTWVRTFHLRQGDWISARKTSGLGHKPSSEGICEQVDNWLSSFEKNKAKVSASAQQIVNYYESRIGVSETGKLTIRRLVTKGKKKAQHAPKNSGRDVGTSSFLL